MSRLGMLIRVTARAVLSIGQFCDPGVRGALITGAVPPILVGPIVYLATWRDSWQLIGEVKTRLGQSTVGSVASFTIASRLPFLSECRLGLNKLMFEASTTAKYSPVACLLTLSQGLEVYS